MYRKIDAEAVVRTVAVLRDRVTERFPASGLSRVARELHEVALQSAARVRWSARPLLSLRLGMGALGLLLVVGFGSLVRSLHVSLKVHDAVELIQVIESGVNDLVFLSVGLYFLVSLEGRIKRTRVLAALHELRSLAHIVDMHQLTKDPERLVDARDERRDTRSSPKRTLTRFELGRYLDYCSEMLALLGKIAALYAETSSDPVALAAVDEVEDLTSGLANKIWQKIMVLQEGTRSGSVL